GQWYLVASDQNQRAKDKAGAVFNVKAPKLDVTIRDPNQNDGADVSGKLVPTGSLLQFQIGTNMYTVLDTTLRNPVYNNAGSSLNSDGYLDIVVKDETGAILTSLNSITGSNTLKALNVTTQPFTWGRNNSGRGPGIDYVWNTSTYAPGTYVISVESKLNNMQSNYLSGTAPYTGRTVSEAKTITLVANATSKTGVYRPGVGFFLKMDHGNTWNPPSDWYLAWDNAAVDLPIAGDWNADGRTETGVYRPGVGFYLKMDHGSTWNPSTDRYLAWDNAAGDLPIAGNFV
ncbi:MAG: DUF3821 domain-containing protein, partial [Euryarchaeota archaeon]|nr:DUF3821 domain-containing protein [Euryarchaeota archaeon]